jgi:AcrR family transcriptional regulator
MVLADTSGLGSLTMRQLAGQLGVEAASLYNHVANKDEILDGLADLIVGEIDLPSMDVGWRESMRRRAISAHEVFSRHPWAIDIVDSPERSGPARWAYSDRVLGILLEAGFTTEMAMNAFIILDGFIYGFVRQSLTLAPPEGLDSLDVAEQTLAVVSRDLYPHLHDVIVESAMKVGFDEAGVFDLGLEFILDGLEARLSPAE